MYPIALMIDRICLKEFVLPPNLPRAKPYTIKEGQIAWIPIYAFHHDPKYFEEPDKFDPERFLGERRRNNLNCDAYLRSGIQNVHRHRFVLLQTLLFHLLGVLRCITLQIETLREGVTPLKLTKDGFDMKTVGGFWLNLSPRKNTHDSIMGNVANGTRKS
jgi:cytochrome P450 family 9